MEYIIRLKIEDPSNPDMSAAELENLLNEDVFQRHPIGMVITEITVEARI